MIQFRIYNDEKTRRWLGFPSMKDPYMLENTLLRIINELFMSMGLPQEREFNILNPRLSNLHFVYYTSSNFHAWGELPLGYIYNDMVRHIQNRNSTNNFTVTIESFFIDNLDCNRWQLMDDGVVQTSGDIAYDIVSSYVSENYLNSYNYMMNNNNGVMVVTIPSVANGTKCFILSVGFDPYSMAKWLCTNDNLNDINSLPFARQMSFKSIASTKINDPNIIFDMDCSDSRVRKNINYCIDMVKKYEISALRKKSIYDTEIKYGNFPIDYNWLSIYDAVTPAVYYNYVDNRQDRFLLTKFNQPCDYRVDYRILKRQNDLIKIAEKRKEIGVGN